MLGASRASLLIHLALACAFLLAHAPAHADPAPDYYSAVDDSSPAALRASLHAIIRDHTRLPYTASSSLDTWKVLEAADEDPEDSSAILDVYRNASYTKVTGGNSFYNREHVWPKSYGYPRDSSANYPYTDCHALFLSDVGYNSARGNKPFASCGPGCNEYVTASNGGRGGGSGVYAGNSNWTQGAASTGTWEAWHGRRGDIARALFYMDVRYEGGHHSITGAAEPDLILTDDRSLIVSSTSNQAVAYMGLLSVLIAWHREDPVDEIERRRNDQVELGQGNRNPFIDRPEWAECVFAGICGASSTAGVFINEIHYDNVGADVGEFVEIAGPAGMSVAGWQLIAYNGADGKPYTTVSLSGVFPDQGGCMGTLDFAIPGLQNGSPDGVALVSGTGAVIEFMSYEGSFVAVSGPAAGMTSTDIGVSELSSTPIGYSLQRAGSGSQAASFHWTGPRAETRGERNSDQTFAGCGEGGGGGGSPDPWINEFHYDNDGVDVDEFVEIAGPAGLSLDGWELLGYNGANGLVYKVIALGGTIPSQMGGHGTRSFAFPGLQNGSPDGIALVSPGGHVAQFLSYEGTFTAVNGPAAGMTSIDVGLSEPPSTPLGFSLQLSGAGCWPQDFTWSSPTQNTAGQVNRHQQFVCQ